MAAVANPLVHLPPIAIAAQPVNAPMGSAMATGGTPSSATISTMCVTFSLSVLRVDCLIERDFYISANKIVQYGSRPRLYKSQRCIRPPLDQGIRTPQHLQRIEGWYSQWYQGSRNDRQSGSSNYRWLGHIDSVPLESRRFCYRTRSLRTH